MTFKSLNTASIIVKINTANYRNVKFTVHFQKMKFTMFICHFTILCKFNVIQ